MAAGHRDLTKAELVRADQVEKNVVVSDPSRSDNPMVYVSEAFAQRTGYRPEESPGRHCRFLQRRETDAAAVEACRVALAAMTEITVGLLIDRKVGSKSWNRLRLRPSFDERGKRRYFVGAQNAIRADTGRRPLIEAIFVS